MKRFLCGVLAALMLVALCACGKQETATVRLSEVTHSVFYAPQYVALEQGFFADEGLNIELTNGLVMSEAVMMGLGPYIGREYAHDLVYELCRQAIHTHRPLLDILCEHPEINIHLGRAELARLCDPANYLGQAGVMVDNVLARAARQG